MVFKSTLIWVLSMIHSLGFLVWTFTSSSRDQEAELASEEDAKALLVPSTESVNKMPWNGSKRNTTVQFIIDLYKLIIATMSSLFTQFLTPKPDRYKKRDYDISTAESSNGSAVYSPKIDNSANDSLIFSIGNSSLKFN